MDSVDPCASEKDQGVVAMVGLDAIGLDAMKRANSTLEDFVSLYSYKKKHSVLTDKVDENRGRTNYSSELCNEKCSAS